MRSFLLAAVLSLASQAALADIAMPFEMPWMNTGRSGDMFRTADHPNSIFVLEAYANFCGACNDNADNVDALADVYTGNDRVQIVDMSLDSNDRETQRWIANHNPNHPVIKDVNRNVWRQLGGQYIPTVTVIDCHGQIQYTYTGEWGNTQKQALRRTIDGLLAQTCE